MVIEDEHGNRTEESFDRLHLQMPGKIPESLKNLQSEERVPVNKYTLQHQNYDNVFAFGQALDLPIFTSDMATLAQGNVVRNNVIKKAKGKKVDAEYDGYQFNVMLMAMNKLVRYRNDYSNRDQLWFRGWTSLGYYFYFDKYVMGRILGATFAKKKPPPFWKRDQEWSGM